VVHQVEAAVNAGKLVTGVENIWREATNKNCRLLVVEKNFTYAAQKVSDTEIIPIESSNTNALFIKDAVDDIIEKVLINGGDVEFVEEDLLKGYGKIGLILYY
jgi:SpoU rRNA methylase family enzyme